MTIACGVIGLVYSTLWLFNFRHLRTRLVDLTVRTYKSVGMSGYARTVRSPRFSAAYGIFGLVFATVMIWLGASRL